MHDAVHVPVPQPPKVQCFEFLLREDTGMERIRSLEVFYCCCFES